MLEKTLKVITYHNCLIAQMPTDDIPWMVHVFNNFKNHPMDYIKVIKDDSILHQM